MLLPSVTLDTVIFSHRGAKNSFPVKHISPYDIGEIQKTHFSQFGIDVGGMTKPPHRRKNINDNVLPTEETGAVCQYETTHRNNDSDVECMRNSTSRWRKNLDA